MGDAQPQPHRTAPAMNAITSSASDEFKGRVALVTGAAGQGIGRAVAARLIAGGANTVVTVRVLLRADVLR